MLEAIAGLTLLAAGHLVSPAPFVSEFGDNNVANSSARRNATPNLQIAEVLHRRADFVAQERITTRQLRVSTDDNVLGDPLSRGPKYMNKFREEATKMGATSFVRMKVPDYYANARRIGGPPSSCIAGGIRIVRRAQEQAESPSQITKPRDTLVFRRATMHDQRARYTAIKLTVCCLVRRPRHDARRGP